MDEPTKRCSTCHLDRPLTDDNVRRAAADGLQARCRMCSREWYVLNQVAHKANVTARNRRVRGEHKARMATYLFTHPCVDCGETDLRVLDFDHEDPAQKLIEVGRLIGWGVSWKRVETEMAKCSVRCANCHRRKTAEEHGYWRQEVEQRRQLVVRAAATARLAALLGG